MTMTMTLQAQICRAPHTIRGPRYHRPDGSTWSYEARLGDPAAVTVGTRLTTQDRQGYVPPESRFAGVVVSRDGDILTIDVTESVYAGYEMVSA